MLRFLVRKCTRRQKGFCHLIKCDVKDCPNIAIVISGKQKNTNEHFRQKVII